jgi:hypothetical protein
MHFSKLVCASVLVFGLIVTNTINAQNTAKSTNISTINGKKYYLHKVAHAQSLYGIAKIYGVDTKAILDANPGAMKGIIVGQELKIPFNNTVTSGTPNVTNVDNTTPAKQDNAKATEQPQQAQTSSTNTTSSNASSSTDVDLLSMVDDGTSAKKEKEYVTATFKSTRNINFHTSEILGKRCLDIRIQHRFGDLSSGANNAWGLDGGATIMVSAEYSHNGRWMVGISRCSYNKVSEGFFKWKILRQVKHGLPFSLTYFGGLYYSALMNTAVGQTSPDFYDPKNPTQRMSFVHELIIASKITPWLSLQVAPSYVHYNLVGTAIGMTGNDCFALLGVVRAKYNKRQAIIFEYGYRVNTNYVATGAKYYNTMGIGWEIETGGHVFQVFVTNSQGITENEYIMRTLNSWTKQGSSPASIRIGFNITRIFALSKKSEL